MVLVGWTRCSSLAVMEVLEGAGVDRDWFLDSFGDVIEEEGVERDAAGDFFYSPDDVGGSLRGVSKQ